MSESRIRFALHGGAGVIDPKSFGAAREAAYQDALRAVAQVAVDALRAGAWALDVVQQAVTAMEDCAFFNAGHGAVLNRDGAAELDAAIMDGVQRAAGAVAAVRAAKHPIALARAVLAQGDHVLLVGPGADRFALDSGLECVAPEYFQTAERRQQLARAQAAGRISLDHDEHYAAADKTGTVGAVARDLQGRLAAATSTGGMTNKLPGRVGDSALIGSGTWADNRSCCISATGHGEFFIRTVLAYDIHAQMLYAGTDLAAAAEAALARVAAMGGSGGLIAIAANGDMVLPFNSPGMYRAWCGADGQLQVAIYR